MQNKNAQLRYQILDRCFSNFNRKYTFEDLLNIVNDKLYDLNGTRVSVRQLRADMENMQNRPYCAPIKSYPMGFGKKHYYRYTDPDFSIFKNELSIEEVNKLRSTIEMLGRYRGIPSYAWLEEVISSLEYRFGVKSSSENVVEFEQNEQLKGLEFLSDLIDAAVNHRPLAMLYKTYKGKELRTVLHPYYIKQYNNRWFVFGLEVSEKYGKYITNKPLDRIVSYSQAADVAFIENTGYNFKEFFMDIVGVTMPKEHPEPERVVLRFNSDRLPYILSKPIHHTQQVIDPDQGVLQLLLRPNQELESLILSYGPHAEVLEPEWLKQQILSKIRESLQNYESMQSDCTNER